MDIVVKMVGFKSNSTLKMKYELGLIIADTLSINICIWNKNKPTLWYTNIRIRMNVLG